MPITREETIEVIRQALRGSPNQFEAITHGQLQNPLVSAWDMPESWLVHCIMRAARDVRLAAVPEVHMTHRLPHFESGGVQLNHELFPDVGPGEKIDLFLGDHHAQVPGLLRVRAVIEFKGPQGGWPGFHPNLVRLQHLRQVIDGNDQIAMFVYVSGQQHQQHHQGELNQLAHHLQVPAASIDVSEAIRSSVSGGYSYIYMYILP